MEVLLIVCLLVGIITCVPVEKDSGSSDVSRNMQFPPLNLRSGGGSFNLGSSSSFPAPHSQGSAPQYAGSSAGPVYSNPGVSEGDFGGPVGYAPSSGYDGGALGNTGYVSLVPEVDSSSEGGEYGAAYAPSGGYEGGASGGSYGGGYGGEGSYGYPSAPAENWGSGSAAGYGASVEQPQEVFSDVSGLDPVYGFSSRSSYQRGRSVVSQARYTPRGSAQPAAPVYRPLIRTPVVIQNPVPQAPVKQSAPAKAMTKGGY